MTAAADLTNMRFGRLVAVERAGSRGGHSLWRLRCDCGRETISPATVLKTGRAKSCGCLFVEANTTHGYAHTRLYKVWSNMMSRCDNPKTRFYENYGGRGISYVAEWADPGTFISWALANGYRDDLEIDRIDNDGHYGPDNCRFVTRQQNLSNRRNSRLVRFEGVEMTITELSRKAGMHPTVLRRRILEVGMSADEAVAAGGKRCRKTLS